MNSRERIFAALDRKIPDRLPYTELHIDMPVRQAVTGKAEPSMKDVGEALRMDAVGMPFYPTLYAEWATDESGKRHIAGGRLKTPADLGILKLEDPLAPAQYEPVKRFVDENAKDRAVFCATNIGLDPLLLGMGVDNFSYALVDFPEMVEDVLRVYSDWARLVSRELKKCGVDFLWYTDDIAYNTGLMFSPAFFRETAKPFLAYVLKDLGLRTVYHSDGLMSSVLPDLIDLGFNGFHPIDPAAMDLAATKKEFGSKICLIGNIDLRTTLVSAPLEVVRQEVRQRFSEAGKGGGYICSSANSLAEYCRTENILAMRDEIGRCVY